jgi:colanic acid biosynthesis protein WcaH
MLSNEQFLSIIDATPLVSIDLILCNERGEILLGKRTARPAQNFWFVPGGRIRKNERVRDALKRISLKELGVAIETATLMGAFDHIYPDNFLGQPGVNTHYVVLGYSFDWKSSVPVKADEQHSELRWWTVPELLANAEVHENTKNYFRPL